MILNLDLKYFVKQVKVQKKKNSFLHIFFSSSFIPTKMAQ